MQEEKPIVVKETRNAYFYESFSCGFYIIRWLKSGGYHLYPDHDLEFPESFESEEAFKNDMLYGMMRKDDILIVNEIDAVQYAVPKRY
jgi:hypothetical protein